jgi:hypothetical protein
LSRSLPSSTSSTGSWPAPLVLSASSSLSACSYLVYVQNDCAQRDNYSSRKEFAYTLTKKRKRFFLNFRLGPDYGCGALGLNELEQKTGGAVNGGSPSRGPWASAQIASTITRHCLRPFWGMRRYTLTLNILILVRLQEHR